MKQKSILTVIAFFTISLFGFFSCERRLEGLDAAQWTIGSGTSTFARTWHEDNATVYVFRLKENSLCAIYGVRARLTVNGTEVMNKVYDDAATQTTDQVTVNIPAGADVQVSTERFSTGSTVQCVWGGEAKFELQRQ